MLVYYLSFYFSVERRSIKGSSMWLIRLMNSNWYVNIKFVIHHKISYLTSLPYIYIYIYIYVCVCVCVWSSMGIWVLSYAVTEVCLGLWTLLTSVYRTQEMARRCHIMTYWHRGLRGHHALRYAEVEYGRGHDIVPHLEAARMSTAKKNNKKPAIPNLVLSDIVSKSDRINEVA